jgi:hypothetical protein
VTSLIVVVKKDQHANLDSFPFRYGFSENKDYKLSIVYNSKPKVQHMRFGQQRLLINNAKFINPITGDHEEGNFVLVRNAEEHHYSVVTVIRSDKNVDKTLSKALKLFRKHKYVTVDQLINYFHPRYIEGKIKTHHDLKKYLIRLNSDNEEKINEIESVLKDAYNEIEKLELEINKATFKDYHDYANSEEYSRDVAIASGWGDLYDEARDYADAAFNEYLNEYNGVIQDREKKVGVPNVFMSWTKIEKSMGELFPEATDEEIQRILRGWKIHEKLFNTLINESDTKLKSGSALFIKELSQREREDYFHWQEVVGSQLNVKVTKKKYKD